MIKYTEMKKMSENCSGTCCDECKRNVIEIKAMLDESERSMMSMLEMDRESDELRQQIDGEIRRQQILLDQRQQMLNRREERLLWIERRLLAATQM